MITVVDYGMGNLWSVINAIRRYNRDVIIGSVPEDIYNADKLVLPGVGAFKYACEELERRQLNKPILDFIASGKPFLGICLGMQLLFTKSYEAGEQQGLGVIEGEVIKFPETKGLKVPHMGWNSIAKSGNIRTQDCPIFKGLPDNIYVYFVHSYYPKPKNDNIIATTTNYGVTFCSSLWKDNIYAMQFHPEKSQRMGLRIIENFVDL